MTSHDPFDPATRRRNRWLLLGLFALFFGTLIAAGALRFSGWRPAGLKNHGELLHPPGDLRALTPRTLDGAGYAWMPIKRTWRIVLAPPAGCDDECARLLRDIDKVWQLMGKDAEQVDVLWLCADAACALPANAPQLPTLKRLQPADALRAALPRARDPRGVPVYVIDPNGFVILRYAPGFDPAGLRADLAKLLKLK